MLLHPGTEDLCDDQSHRSVANILGDIFQRRSKKRGSGLHVVFDRIGAMVPYHEFAAFSDINRMVQVLVHANVNSASLK